LLFLHAPSVMAMAVQKEKATMKPQQKPDDPIELGKASLDTKGGPEGMDDFQGGLFRWPGLSLD